MYMYILQEELVRLRGQQQQQPLVDGEDEVIRLKRILEEKEKEVKVYLLCLTFVQVY